MTFKYKDCEVVIIEEKENFIIRLMNKFGFRWFKTANKDEKYLKVKKAYNIEQEIINNPFGKYYGSKFIAV